MIKQTLALVGLSISLSANAAIFSVDSSFGVDTITRDTETRLDWLDVTITRDLSYNQVTAQFGAGGIYEGYRYATMAELDRLIRNWGYRAVTQNCTKSRLHCDINGDVGDQEELVQRMISMLGDTYHEDQQENGGLAVNAGGAGFTSGILGSNNVSTLNYDVASIRDNELIDIDYGDIVNTGDSYIQGNRNRQATGSFLVAPSVVPVPVPAAAWLFGSALVGLVGIKRKK